MSNEPDAEAATAVRILAIFEEYASSQRDDLRILSYIDSAQESLDDRLTHALDGFKSTHREVGPDEAQKIVSAALELADQIRQADEADIPALVGEVLGLATNEDGTVSVSMLDDLVRMGGMRPSSGRMKTSLLIALVTGFEVFIGRLARLLAHHDPDKVISGDTSVSWSTLSRAASVEDVRADLIERHIDNLLRESAEEWVKFLRERFDIRYPTSLSSTAKEGFLRRNAAVHGDGAATREYVRRCQEAGIRGEDLGESIEPSSDYLREFAAEMYCIAFQLTASATASTCTGVLADKAEGRLADALYHELASERYMAVAKVGAACRSTKFRVSANQAVTHVNYWLAMRALGRGAECAQEIQDWDVSALGDQYRLAKLVLTDRVPEAAAMAERLRTTGEIEPRFWMTWPLLAEVRAYVDSRPDKELEQVAAGENATYDPIVDEGAPE